MMSDSSIALYFRHMFEYEEWANRQIVSFLSTNAVPADVVMIFGHLIADMQPWIYLLNGHDVPESIDCSPEWSLEECRMHLQSNTEALRAIFMELEDADLSKSITSHAPNGRTFQNTVSEILTQILSHGQHHRGQIEWIVEREMGQYLATSYMPFLRQRSPAN
ncbi:MAG: DinB family protein [Capsulimonas sp.]|nr:DinB family protein [Capsulimonas sp.]